MTDASASPFRRFPWVQLVFCAACLVMAAWTWMRYSYAWEVTEADFAGVTEHNADKHPFVGRYVAYRSARGGGLPETMTGRVNLREIEPEDDELAPSPDARFCLVTTLPASRFHPASIAGLVVGVMGVFIFGLYLRRWLREREATLTTEHTEVTETAAP